MFPGRLSQLPPAMFAQLADLLEHETPGAPVVNLSVGDPRGSVPGFVTEALNAHAHQFGEYPAINGTADWRDAAAGWIRRRFGLPDSAIDPDTHVLPLNGTREGLFLAAFIVTPETKNGQRPAILIPNPFYQCYAVAALAAGAEPIFVPCPALVNSSSSNECGTRPSTMCAADTPPSIAFRQAASFGRIPPPTEPSAAETSAALASETMLEGSAGSRIHPATSVRNITL